MTLRRLTIGGVGNLDSPQAHTADLTTTPNSVPHIWTSFDEAVRGLIEPADAEQAKLEIPAYAFIDQSVKPFEATADQTSWWVLNDDVIRWYNRHEHLAEWGADAVATAGQQIENSSWRIRQNDGVRYVAADRQR